MHHVDGPESTDAETGDETSDTQLDEFESDLDNVTAALDAIDTDDLDAAEALVAELTDKPAPAPDRDSAASDPADPDPADPDPADPDPA